MIIEDESLIALDISEKLQDLGYHVQKIISHSEQAIDFLSFHTPDLVLCDINIKGEHDGIQVAQYILKTKRIPWIFLTSLADADTLDKAKQILPYGYIVKPFTTLDLSSNIEMALFKFQSEIDQYTLTKDKIDAVCDAPLSTIEFEYLKDLTKGLNNQQLSEKHFVSINTVKTHLSRIRQKLDCTSRAEIMQIIIDLFGIKR